MKKTGLLSVEAMEGYRDQCAKRRRRLEPESLRRGWTWQLKIIRGRKKMAIKSFDQYVESLRKLKPTVYMFERRSRTRLITPDSEGDQCNRCDL
jgi:hypothetical protein